MTMIPPKIKKLPGLRSKPKDSISKPTQGSSHSNNSLLANGSKMVR